MRPIAAAARETFIKTKCANAQEFVVGGYSPSTVLPRAIGALVVGYYEHGQLIYAGRIGTGYTRAVARDLWKRLHPLETDKPPFDRFPRAKPPPRHALGRAQDGDRIAFPRLDRRRPGAAGGVQGRARGQAAAGGRSGAAGHDRCARRSATDKTGPRIAAEAAKAMTKKIEAAKTASTRATKAPRESIVSRKAKAWKDGDVRFTHPDRVYWVDVGVTKQDLADYYRAVWDWMAPQVVDRPLALVRCPDGTKGQCFFQKHASAGLTEQNLHTRDRQQRAADHRGRRSRRPALAGAGGRARGARARLDDRSARHLRPHRVRPRSRRGRRPGRRSSRPRATCASGSPRSISKASSSCPAARACTWCCRSTAPTGTRPRPSRRRWRWRWRRTRPTATSPR